jgi:hypothetical protein
MTFTSVIIFENIESTFDELSINSRIGMSLQPAVFVREGYFKDDEVGHSSDSPQCRTYQDPQ